MDVPHFDMGDVHGFLDDADPMIWFESAMIELCAPFFDDADSNYDVEQRLVSAGVVDADDCDSESCALVVRFSGRTGALQFISRLNDYFMQKAELMQKAREF